MVDPRSGQPPAARFPATHWGKVVMAGEPAEPGARAALAELCLAYWYPLYAFVRRMGYPPEECADLVQGTIATLLARGWLAALTPEGGRFRSFPKAVCVHHVADCRDRDRAARRGGGRPPVAIDGREAEGHRLAAYERLPGRARVSCVGFVRPRTGTPKVVPPAPPGGAKGENMATRKALPAAAFILYLAGASPAEEPGRYARRAREVTEHTQRHFFDPRSGVYFRSATERKPDYVWLQGVQFSNLVAAARSEPGTYGPLLQDYFTALDKYWDAKVEIPGYEAAPTRGNGNDKYYDDNAWLVITFLEAYETNHDPAYLIRADETLKFVLSGWDEESGGGIWWHQGHKDGTKNACSNGPAAVGCLRMATFLEGDAAALVDRARKIVAWTRGALQAEDGLFEDRRVVASGEVKRGKLTYNSALMLRALLGLYRATGEKGYLAEAQRIGTAADRFLDAKTGVYRDAVRYAHFMVEADLELYRTTKEEYLLKRATKNADAFYERWKAKPPGDLISNAAIGRMLWLMAETETDAGRAFWQRSDMVEK